MISISKSICIKVLKRIINCNNILLFTDNLDKVLSKNDINPGVTVDSQKEIMDNSEFLPCCSFSSSTPEVLSVKSIRKRTVSENKSKRTKSSGIFAGMFFLNLLINNTLNFLYDNTNLH